MSVLLIILLIIIAIIVLVLIIAAASKKNYSIKRDIIINAPAQKIFDYVKFIKNQDYYNKWVMTDPAMKKDFRGTDGTVGFVYGWNGNKKAGEGEQEIQSITPGKSVVSEVRFLRPFPGKSILETEVISKGDNTSNVSLQTSSYMKFPMNIMIPMVSGMLANDMDITLQNLKRIMES